MVNRTLGRHGAMYGVGVLLVWAAAGAARGDVLDDVGVRALWATHPELVGTGVTIAQPESQLQNTANDFEVNPTAAGTSVPITYVLSATSTATTFPNAIGAESSHADIVASRFYGSSGPVPGVPAAWNYDSSYYINQLIFQNASIPAKVVNQSWAFKASDTSNPAAVLQAFDNYVSTYKTVIVSGAGNLSNPDLYYPSNAYNLISVTTLEPGGNVGPTDGRSKPDISAPGMSLSSFATPLVSGVATQLVQAGNANAGGAGTASASTDPWTIKALLLNGATKSADWTHSSTVPLDTRYGAGCVNAQLSYKILAGGKKSVTQTTSTAGLNGAHPAISAGTLLPTLGWNNQSITSTASSDSVHHYLLNLPGTGAYQLTATLAWDRLLNLSKINNMDLFLYNASSGSLVSQSISGVDNVEQLYQLSLPAGQYDLQVLKHGGSLSNANVASNTDTYALAWSAYLMGDGNYDGTVDLADFNLWFNHVGSAPGTFLTGDMNHDGTVDLGDFNIWFGQVGGSSLPLTAAMASMAVAVPEPASMGLLGASVLLLLRRRAARG